MSLFQRFKSYTANQSDSYNNQNNSSLVEHDPYYGRSFQRQLRDAIRDRSAHKKVVPLEHEIRQTRLDRLKTLVGLQNDSDKILLKRRHDHLIRPLENNFASLKRSFSNGTITTLFLAACLFGGYAYARLKNDEVLRRNFYCRYANFITIFDTWTPILEDKLFRSIVWLENFDSTYFFWYFKTSQVAEYKAYRKLEGQIIERQSQQGDEVSKAILDIEKEFK